MVALAPKADALVALGFVVEVRRIHGDILRHAHAVLGMVRPDAVGEQRVEDQEVTGLHLDIDDLQAGGVGVHRIAVGGLRLHPFVEMLEEFGHALEAADVAVLPLQAENALHADRQRPHRRVHVPMDEAAGIALHLSGRIEVGAVDRDP